MELTPEEHYHNFVSDCAVVSNEGFKFVPGMVAKARDRIIAHLRDHARQAATWDFSRPEVINAAQVSSALSRHRYLDMADFYVDTPVGFNTDEHELPNYLSDGIKPTLDNLEKGFDIIQARVKWILSQYLNDPALFSEHPARDAVEEFGNEHAYDHLITVNALSMYFTESRSHLAPFTAVYGSNNECVRASRLINDLNKQRWSKLNPKTVKKVIDDVNTLATHVFTSLGKQNNVDTQNVKIVMNAVLLAAKWSRQYAILTSKIIDCTTALKQTEKKLLTR